MRQKANPVIGDFKSDSKPNQLLHKYLPISLKILGVVIVLIVVASVVIKYIDDNRATSVCSAGEGKTLVDQAASALKSDNTNQLSNATTSIQKLPGYSQDPNCTYVVTAYYVHAFNIPKSKTSLKLFNKYYKNQKLNPALLKYESVEELQQSVSNMSKELNQDETNSDKLLIKPMTGQSEK